MYGWATTIVVSYTCSKAGSGTMESCVSSGISQGRSPDSANDKGDLSFVKQPRVLLVDKWDKNEHVCMKRLPGRIPGLECGQHVTRYILAVVVAGYLVVIEKEFLMNSTVLYNIGVIS